MEYKMLNVYKAKALLYTYCDQCDFLEGVNIHNRVEAQEYEYIQTIINEYKDDLQPLLNNGVNILRDKIIQNINKNITQPDEIINAIHANNTEEDLNIIMLKLKEININLEIDKILLIKTNPKNKIDTINKFIKLTSEHKKGNNQTRNYKIQC